MRAREIGVQTVVILKPRILYDLDRSPSEIKKLLKETVNSFSYVKFKKILKQLFLESSVEKLKLFLRSSFVLILSFFCSWK